MVLAELILLHYPYAEDDKGDIDNNNHIRVDSKVSKELSQLVDDCLDKKREKRPTFENIMERPIIREALKTQSDTYEDLKFEWCLHDKYGVYIGYVNEDGKEHCYGTKAFSYNLN